MHSFVTYEPTYELSQVTTSHSLFWDHGFLTNFITYEVFPMFHTLSTFRFPAQLQLCNERSMSMQETGLHFNGFPLCCCDHSILVCNCDHISLMERVVVLLERELDHGIRFSLEPEPTLFANAIQVFYGSKYRGATVYNFEGKQVFFLKRWSQVIRYVVLLLIDCTTFGTYIIFNSRDVCNMWNLVWIPDQTWSELSFEESARV
jgi:hypothetical protein